MYRSRDKIEIYYLMYSLDTFDSLSAMIALVFFFLCGVPEVFHFAL